MKVADIITSSLRRFSDKDLTNMHSKIHQLYGIVRRNKSTQMEWGEQLREKHKIVANEILRRDIEHKTPIA